MRAAVASQGLTSAPACCLQECRIQCQSVALPGVIPCTSGAAAEWLRAEPRANKSVHLAVADPTRQAETPIGACLNILTSFQEHGDIVVGDNEHGSLINDCIPICLQMHKTMVRQDALRNQQTQSEAQPLQGLAISTCHACTASGPCLITIKQ